LVEEYNQLTRLEYSNIRDFLIVQYQATRRKESPFWSAYTAEPLPSSLEHKIKLFKAHAQVAFYEEESFPDTFWAAIWLGQDQWPDSYDPMLENYDFERLKVRFDQMKQIIQQAAHSMPPYAEYLRRYCH
jgi:tryptophan halogenase